MQRTFRYAIVELSRAQKSRRGVSLYSRFVNRPLGRVLAAVCFRFGLSPNAVTALSALATALGLIVLAVDEPHPTRAFVVAAFLVLGFALDSADGQVARLTGRFSPAGEWLDHVVDAGKIVAVHASVLILAYRYLDLSIAWLLIPLAFQVVSILTFTGGELERLLRSRNTTDSHPSERPPSTIRALVLLPADYGVLACSFILLAWPPLFAAVYLLLFVANVVIAGLLLRKWFHALASASSAP